MTTDLIAQAEALSAMIYLGEKISFGQDTAMIDALIARVRELEGANTQLWEANLRLQRERDALEAMRGALKAAKHGLEWAKVHLAEYGRESVMVNGAYSDVCAALTTEKTNG
jgi:DNA repair exonuclease SbcCD ATPase subunit